MIEFVLLFALGFLAAALVGLLVAPVVHRRVVRFAEDRLKATMPISPQEVRAQKDAARAVYAAENARTLQSLKRERERSVTLMLGREHLLRSAQKLEQENGELRAQIADMSVEAADLRASARQVDQNIDRLKSAMEKLEADYAIKANAASLLTRQLDRVSTEIDGLRADAASHAAEVDGLQARILALREERRVLREDLKREGEQARALEIQLAAEEARARQFEARLAQEATAVADKDALLDRRRVEIERLKARSRETAAELREAKILLHAAGLTLPARSDSTEPPDTTTTEERADDAVLKTNAGNDHALLPAEDDVRSRAARFIDDLTSDGPSDDAALREELAAIAAEMVALTARREGEASPIRALLDREPDLDGRPSGRPSLAGRTRALLKR